MSTTSIYAIQEILQEESLSFEETKSLLSNYLVPDTDYRSVEKVLSSEIPTNAKAIILYNTYGIKIIE